MGYDAKDILDFVQEKWAIPTPKLPYSLPNGLFETGVLTPWTGTGVVEDTKKHSGNYGVYLENPTNYIQQTFSPILKEMIDEFSFWVCGYSQITITLTLSDDSTREMNVTVTPFNVFQQINLLTLVKNVCTGELLFQAGTSVKGIKITAYDNEAWVDDVVLNVNGDLYLALDEFNPTAPLYQIVFINKPANTLFVSPMVTKLEQSVMLEVHCKLVRYDPTTVEDTREVLKDIKDELNRIFTLYRYDNVGSIVNLSGWVDSKFPHGFGEDREPLELVSRLTVEISEYKALDGSLIGVRVARVSILGIDILGLTEALWEDTDPWVHIQIPRGPLLEQHLLGPHVHGEFVTHDWNSIYTALFNTEIPENEDHYPINIDNSKSEFATDPEDQDFIIDMIDHEGTVQTFQFVNVKIKQVKLERSTTSGQQETLWRIFWMSDYYYIVPEEE